ncbi:unannotated protein [freshwater metagenome]|uniref:Unannotated protein n=1 Tax=freshwater metagenome TaxID=449393 RepID=A0A6J7D770_9ZZZZ
MSGEATEATRLPDGRLMAGNDAPVGGQAILEGVMMRGVGIWAVAVREPEGEIEIRSFPLKSVLRRHRALRLPVIRGAVALFESMGIGFKALQISADIQLGEEEELSRGAWIGAMILSLGLAVGLFFVIPVALTSLIRGQLHSSLLFWLVEGLLRTSIFLGYLALLAKMPDLRRVFEYHGAEHKTIACYEGGQPLTPENAERYSRLHPRCGTSFLLIVMVIAIFMFAPIGLPAWYWLVLSRILGVPLIAGLSFEAIRWFGRNRSKSWVRSLMWPGLQLQRLTTREPDHDQLAVAIASLRAVLDGEDPADLADAANAGLEVAA